jgi:ABC-type multidrug transport system fused ATPase/permease subunit
MAFLGMNSPIRSHTPEEASKLFKHAIRKGMGDKAVVLVTDRYDLLPMCDKILYLEHGIALGCDSWDQMLEKNTRFKKFLPPNIMELVDG